MSFVMSKAVDPEKVFLIKHSILSDRLDPDYYRPYYRRRYLELSNCPFPVVSLGKMNARVFQGVSQNIMEDSPTTLLKVKNITTDGQIDYTDTEPVADVPKFKLLQYGDIISPFIGQAIRQYKFARFVGPSDTFTVDNNTGVIRLLDHRINSKFMLAFCKTGLVRWQIDMLMGGGGVPFLGAGNFRKILIPLPSESIQDTVASTLLAAENRLLIAEEKAAKLLQSIDTVLLNQLGIMQKIALPNNVENRMFKCPFSELTGGRLDPFSHHPSFQKLKVDLKSKPHVKVGDVAHLSQELWDQNSLFMETFPYIEIGGINTDIGHIGKTIQIPISEAPSRARMLVRPGDLLISLTRPTRRAIAFVPAAMPLSVASTGFAVIRDTVDTKVIPDFLFHVLRSCLCTPQFAQRSSGGNYPAITEEQLLNVIIPFPSINRQEQIVHRLDEVRRNAQELRRKAAMEFEEAKKAIEAMILGKGDK